MTEAEIRSNIWYNENLIDQYTKEKNDYLRQVDELESLKSKYSGLQVKFENKQQHRQGKLAAFLSSGLQNSILKKYYNGMNSLLNGADFNNAYNGLNEAKNRINRKINEIAQEIDRCENDISYRKSRCDYWRSQLTIVLAEETK